MRVSKINYYLDIAGTVAKRSTCLRKKYGAIIVKDDQIIATGYNGSPRGSINCSDADSCIREEMGVPRGERYELCRSVHAEANAIIAAPRNDMLGSTMYLAGRSAQTGELVPNLNCCSMCRRMTINAGIEHVVIRQSENEYTVIPVAQWVGDDAALTGGY